MSSSIGERVSAHQELFLTNCVIDILNAEKTGDIDCIFRRIQECAAANIPNTVIERALRNKNCDTHLLARRHSLSPVSWRHCEQPYFIFPATDPAEFECPYEENFARLDEAVVMLDEPVAIQRPPLLEIECPNIIS